MTYIPKIKIIILLILIITLLINQIVNITESFNNKKSHRNMIFTSCGNNTNFHNLWFTNTRNYDVYAIYYGNDEEKYNLYQKKVDFIEKRKGSKFQNFHYFYHKYPEIINKYDRFFILDDDIVFNTPDINEMFRISKKYNLQICGPTFKKDPNCKISHHITIQRPQTLLRYVNFIEVNVPLFNKKALHNLMKHYDPRLIGWGVDYLGIWANGYLEKDKYALVDKVGCLNPHDREKNNKRELNNLKNVHERGKVWDEFRRQKNIPGWRHKTYYTIKM